MHKPTSASTAGKHGYGTPAANSPPISRPLGPKYGLAARASQDTNKDSPFWILQLQKKPSNTKAMNNAGPHSVGTCCESSGLLESQFYLEGTAYFPCHLCYNYYPFWDDCCKNYKGIPSSIITSTFCMLAFPQQAEDATGRCVARCDDHTRSTWHVARSQVNPEWPAVNIATVLFQLWKHPTLEQKQVAEKAGATQHDSHVVWGLLGDVRSMILKWWTIANDFTHWGE